MNNISKEARTFLANNFSFDSYEVVKTQIDDDLTTKFLFKTHDGAYIETVLMKFNYG